MRLAHWIALLAVTGAAGTLAIRRRPHRPIALYLAALAGAEGLRAVLSGPVQLERALYFLPAALFAAMLGRVLSARWLYPIGALLFVVPMAVSVAGAERSVLHAVTAAALGTSTLAGFGAVLLRMRSTEPPSFEIYLAMLFLGCDGLALVVPMLGSVADLDPAWPAVSLVNTLFFALCFVLYPFRWWWLSSRSSSSSYSP